MLYDYIGEPDLDRYALKYYINSKHPIKVKENAVEKEISLSSSPSLNKKFEQMNMNSK